MPRAHEAGAERDGRDVSLARGAQTHDETHRAFRQSRLVRVRHDGWIKQRGRFGRILVGEIRADEQLAF